METTGPEILLRIADCAPDMGECLDAILFGRAESMRGHLMEVLARCDDAPFLQHMTSAVRSESFVPMINAWIDDLPLTDAKKNMQDRQIEFA